MKYLKLLSSITILFILVTLTGCGDSNKKDTTTNDNRSEDKYEDEIENDNNDKDKDSDDKENIDDHEAMSSLSDDEKIIVNDIKEHIYGLMDCTLVFDSITDDFYIENLYGESYYKFKIIDSTKNDYDIYFYYNINSSDIYMDILYKHNVSILLKAYEDDFGILLSSDEISAYYVDQLTSEEIDTIKNKVNKILSLYNSKGEVLSNIELESKYPSLIDKAQYLSNLDMAFRDGYIVDYNEKSFVVFNFDTNKGDDIDYGSIGINFIGIKDGIEKNLSYDIYSSNTSESESLSFSKFRVDPFDSSNDLPSMTVNSEKDIVLKFGLSWAGYDEYILEFIEKATSKSITFSIDSSQLTKCTLEEYVNKKYTELSSPLKKVNTISLDDFNIYLNEIDITSNDKNISMTFENIAPIPLGINYVKVKALDSNGNICIFYSDKNIISSISPSEKITLDWNTDIRSDDGFGDDYILLIQVGTIHADGSEWFSSLYTIQ